MSTAPKTLFHGPGAGESGRRQLRRERIEALIVLLITLAVFGLLFWLASFGNGTPVDVNDYWHLMP